MTQHLWRIDVYKRHYWASTVRTQFNNICQRDLEMYCTLAFNILNIHIIDISTESCNKLAIFPQMDHNALAMYKSMTYGLVKLKTVTQVAPALNAILG